MKLTELIKTRRLKPDAKIMLHNLIDEKYKVMRVKDIENDPIANLAEVANEKYSQIYGGLVIEYYLTIAQIFNCCYQDEDDIVTLKFIVEEK